MDRRTFLVGLFGGLAVTPAIIAAASSVEAAPLPEAASLSTLTEADLETVNANWAQAEVAVPGPAPCPTRREESEENRATRCTESQANHAAGAACNAPPGVLNEALTP